MAEPTKDEVLDAIASWLPPRRWFPTRLEHAPLRVAETIELADPLGKARVELLLVGEAGSTRPPFVQVPLSFRPAGTGPAGLEPVARVGGQDVFDGPSDPAFVRAWFAAVPGGDELARQLDLDAARLVAGEQSNSSVILPGADGGPGAILKVFRGLWPGRNPDVEVPAGLASSGWDHVPAPLAWFEHGSEPFHLGVVSRFVPGAEDGFELACAMAARGESFEQLGAELGAVVAEMHERLASVLPVEPRRPVTASELTRHLHERLAWAVGQEPELERWRAPVAELIDHLGTLDGLPQLQRVHGDLHLGQTLRAQGRWFVLDFEGEPMVSLVERNLPGLALRDAAGILRSFDYAAARAGADESWSLAARSAFLAAYRRKVPEAASSTSALLLRAFEVDKALYEVVYELQNRPEWAEIPRRALRRLVGGPRVGPGDGRVGA